MCGFIGEISLDKLNPQKLIKCNELIECRGPDSLVQKNFSAERIQYGLIFNRLAIIDLNNNADQPMESANSSSVIMFNGEIYNHRKLRKELEQKGVKFNTDHSDTEVLLNGLDYFGLDFIEKIKGQFSIAYMQTSSQKVYLIRDRVGQKPLFYSLNSSELIFGSNLKSLVNYKDEFEINNSSIEEYMETGVVSSPNTIFKNINKVEPGQIVEINLSLKPFRLIKTNYWKPENFIDDKIFNEEEFFHLFTEAVSIRLEADVPVANFLSGGIDSTAIAKNLHDSSKTINTFSIAITDSKYDESKWSNEVAKRYGTQHKQVNINSDVQNSEILNSINSLDEPYSDPSVVPSFILCSAISDNYKVALSGDGGDELLGGYKRVSNTFKEKSSLNHLFSKLYNFQPTLFGTGANLSSNNKSYEVSYTGYLFDSKLMKYLNLSSSKHEFIENLRSREFPQYKNLMLEEYNLFLSEMMMLKVDRTSMANSLEVRSPFVDHTLIEYVFSRNHSYYNPENPKQILKSYLSEDFDSSFTSRSKQGFIFDLEGWVFSNLPLISQTLNEGSIINNIRSNFLNYFSYNKTRINANRIWRAFVLEYYLSNIKIQSLQ